MQASSKLWREICRVKKQTSGLFHYFGGNLRRRRYDIERAQNVTVLEGQCGPQREMAVVLLFQPDGLLDSSLLTLTELNALGIGCVVVSNAPLSLDDRNALLQHSYLVIERPNVGYDFGGYREGVLTLMARKLPIDALYLMNDSIWFPVHDAKDTIAACRATSADLYGLHMSTVSRHKSRSYVQSYFLRFSHKILSSKSFMRYWEKLHLIDNKSTVVRYHEWHLAQYFIKRGFSIDALVHSRDLISTIMNITDADEMRLMLEHQSAICPKEAKYIRPVLARSKDALEARDRLMDDIKARKIFVTLTTVHPILLLRMKLPFLKKMRRGDFASQRAALIVLGLTKGFNPAVRAEIANWDSRRPEYRDTVKLASL